VPVVIGPRAERPAGTPRWTRARSWSLTVDARAKVPAGPIGSGAVVALLVVFAGRGWSPCGVGTCAYRC